jgi:hypothetical protein
MDKIYIGRINPLGNGRVVVDTINTYTIPALRNVGVEFNTLDELMDYAALDLNGVCNLYFKKYDKEHEKERAGSGNIGYKNKRQSEWMKFCSKTAWPGPKHLGDVVLSVCSLQNGQIAIDETKVEELSKVYLTDDQEVKYGQFINQARILAFFINGTERNLQGMVRYDSHLKRFILNID